MLIAPQCARAAPAAAARRTRLFVLREPAEAAFATASLRYCRYDDAPPPMAAPPDSAAALKYARMRDYMCEASACWRCVRSNAATGKENRANKEVIALR